MARACSKHGREMNINTILVWKSQGKRLLCRQRWRWEDNIKVKLKEIVCKKSGLDQDFMNIVMNLQIKKN
jgi:hypothetical protein